MKISHDRIIIWMNAIRNTHEKEQYRILENFWESQIKSKVWLLEKIKEVSIELSGNIYIFGGWYGILAQLLIDNFPEIQKVYSIDIDCDCEYYGKILSNNDSKINFITSDMINFIEYENAKLIINTSTEHVDENTFNKWIKFTPEKTPIILQGNDYFDCPEHIRCTKNLDEFRLLNPLKNYIYSGERQFPKENGKFLRFMTIGYR